MSTELTLADRPQAPARAPETVTTRTGMRLSISAARRAVEAVPKNTRDAHAWRWREYSAWCTEAGFHTAERGAAASFLASLGDRGTR